MIKTKYYSDLIPGKEFESEVEAVEAEVLKKKQEEEKVKLEKEKEDRYKEVEEAYNKFNKLRSKYVKDYGYINLEYISENAPENFAKFVRDLLK